MDPLPICYHCGRCNWEGPALRASGKRNEVYPYKKRNVWGDLAIDTASDYEEDSTVAAVTCEASMFKSNLLCGRPSAESVFTGLAVVSRRDLLDWVNCANDALLWLGHQDLAELLHFWTMPLQLFHLQVAAMVARDFYPSGMQMQCGDIRTVIRFLPNGAVYAQTSPSPKIPLYIVQCNVSVHIYMFS